MVTPEYSAAVDNYISAFQEKTHFHRETMDVLAIMAGSKEGNDKSGNSAKSFEALTELLKSSEDEQHILDEFYKMINS